MARARALRQQTTLDPDFRSYFADARGYVYFFLDREDTGERTLVKADQIAVQVMWKAPNLTKQQIVGLRDEKRLPTGIQYHVDHLTVVQDEFDDVIRLGHGDEVSNVLHPAAPGSDGVYDFRLRDSISISFPGRPDPVRVYEVQVRPRDFDREGFVGSIFLDRSTGAIVRMNFTFTPASYVDPYLDYIRISLDNGLWNQKYWLPYRQSVEIRREVPYFDLPVGSVIRGRWEIGGYDFDLELPDVLFAGPRVTTVSEAARRSFPFDSGLYAQLDEDGLVPTPELAQLEEEAVRLSGERYLSGLRRLRLHLPPLSDAFRYNRAEDLVTGLGFSFHPKSFLDLDVLAGYSFGRERPVLDVRLRGGDRLPHSGLEGHLNAMRDLGPLPGNAGIVNSFSALFLESDYLDPWFSSGASVFHTFPVKGATVRLAARVERQRSGTIVVEDPGSFRPVRPIEDGVHSGLDLSVRVGSDAQGGRAWLEAGAAGFEGRSFLTASAGTGWRRSWLSHELELDADLRAGTLAGDPPSQALFLLGGRGTLPGYDYRAYAGNRYWLLSVEGSRALRHPWLRARAFGSAGKTFLSGLEPPADWRVRETPIALYSAGVGLGLGWDTMLLDFGRGLNGGGWEVVLSVNRRFRSIL